MSKKQQKLQAQLAVIETVGKNTIVPVQSKSGFYHKATRIHDAEVMSNLTQEQADAEFDASHADLHLTTIRQGELDQQFERSQERAYVLEDRVNATPEQIKSCEEHSGSEKKDVAFRDWSMPDKVAAVMIAIAGVACLIMSAANVFANLKSSGDAFYVDNSWICFAISLLAPACSVSIKFLSSLFEDNHRLKKRFTHIAFIGSALSFLIWIVLFSMSYSGPTGDIDWDSLGEGDNGLSSALAMMQLMTEVLIGGALFLKLQDIFLKYSPHRLIDNPAYVAAKKSLAEHEAKHEALRNERNENYTRLQMLMAERKAYSNDKLVDVMDRKSRQNALSDL